MLNAVKENKEEIARRSKRLSSQISLSVNSQSESKKRFKKSANVAKRIRQSEMLYNQYAQKGSLTELNKQEMQEFERAIRSGNKSIKKADQELGVPTGGHPYLL